VRGKSALPEERSPRWCRLSRVRECRAGTLHALRAPCACGRLSYKRTYRAVLSYRASECLYGQHEPATPGPRVRVMLRPLRKQVGVYGAAIGVPPAAKARRPPGSRYVRRLYAGEFRQRVACREYCLRNAAMSRRVFPRLRERRRVLPERSPLVRAGGERCIPYMPSIVGAAV